MIWIVEGWLQILQTRQAVRMSQHEGQGLMLEMQRLDRTMNGEEW